MILVFGGTTEGRKTITALEEAGTTYWYSTKTGEQDVTLHHGRRTDGAMDKKAMIDFCQEHAIRLIIDAAHPFAQVLHQTIADVSQQLNLPVIRFERIYPPRDPDIIWIDDYSDLCHLLPSLGEVMGVGLTLLATTGVQSIAKLKPLEQKGIKIYYRILNRKSSIELAHQQGATDEQLCFYDEKESSHLSPLTSHLLLKESGISGGFIEKVKAARAKGMRIIAIKHPSFPSFWKEGCPKDGVVEVNGPYGLRRMVEHLLPEFYSLHSGLTTGTCATAAAIAATLQHLQHTGAAVNSSLFTLNSSLPKEVPVLLPNGETIHVPVGYGEGYAYCIKEAGDDPDVTDGIEVRAEAYPQPLPEGGEWLEIEGGEGIGRFTLPGFDFPPGEPAINRVPREMIRKNLEQFKIQNSKFKIILSVPNGAEIARRTFNPRLGIEGGISIIGVSGIIMPYSEEAFIQSIRKCMEVAKAAFQDVKCQTSNGRSATLGDACVASRSKKWSNGKWLNGKWSNGKCRVVIGSGMKSEQQLRALYPDLPQQAFVEYGNYIGETLKMADELGFSHVTLGIMIGKAVKLAQGHLDTHSRRVVMDKEFIAQLLREANCDLSPLNITVARELWDLLSPDEADRFSQVVVRHCYEHCAPLLPNGELTILLLRNE